MATKVNNKSPEASWETKSTHATRDARIKKVAFAIIVVANLGAHAFFLTYLSLYVTIPQETLIASPYITGVIGALIYLKFKTFDVTPGNYNYSMKLPFIIGKISTFVFCAPIYFAKKYLDFTDYKDPYQVKTLNHELQTKNLSEVSQTLFPHLKNLFRYGVLKEGDKQTLEALGKKYKTAQKKDAFYTKKFHQKNKKTPEYAIHSPWEQVQQDLKALEKEWTILQPKLELPEPKCPDPSEKDLKGFLHKISLPKLRKVSC